MAIYDAMVEGENDREKGGRMSSEWEKGREKQRRKEKKERERHRERRKTERERERNETFHLSLSPWLFYFYYFFFLRILHVVQSRVYARPTTYHRRARFYDLARPGDVATDRS